MVISMIQENGGNQPSDLAASDMVNSAHYSSDGDVIQVSLDVASFKPVEV